MMRGSVARAVWCRARRSVVHPHRRRRELDYHNLRGVHEPYKKYNTYALAALYVYHRRPACRRVAARHRRANRAPSLLATPFPEPRSPPSRVREKLGYGRVERRAETGTAEVRFGGLARKHSAIYYR